MVVSLAQTQVDCPATWRYHDLLVHGQTAQQHRLQAQPAVLDADAGRNRGHERRDVGDVRLHLLDRAVGLPHGKVATARDGRDDATRAFKAAVRVVRAPEQILEPRPRDLEEHLHVARRDRVRVLPRAEEEGLADLHGHLARHVIVAHLQNLALGVAEAVVACKGVLLHDRVG